jgi:hypothetical protein
VNPFLPAIHCATRDQLVLGEDPALKLSLCLTKHHAMKAYLGEWRYSSTHSLTSVLDRGERSASRPCRSTQKERAPGNHWIGGWGGGLQSRYGRGGEVKNSQRHHLDAKFPGFAAQLSFSRNLIFSLHCFSLSLFPSTQFEPIPFLYI